MGVRYLFLYRYKRARGNVCHVKSSILFHECQDVSDLALQFRFGHVFSRAIPRKKRGPNKGAAFVIELSLLKLDETSEADKAYAQHEQSQDSQTVLVQTRDTFEEYFVDLHVLPIIVEGRNIEAFVQT